MRSLLVIPDFLADIYYHFKVPLFEFKEQRWVRKQFYHDAAFKALDKELLSGPNPYRMSYLFPYGETSLRTLYAMAQAVDLKPNDHFVDLGCGRGRAVFFLSQFFGCKATGIDLTPSFIKRAQALAHFHRARSVSFLCQDFLSYNFEKATCVYLYGSSYSQKTLQKLENQLLKLPSGSRIMTVSQPLSSIPYYASFEAAFAWGKGSLFFHRL